MDRQGHVVTKALKEIQGALVLTNKQTQYLRYFLCCIYDLGKAEGKSHTARKKSVQIIFNGIVIDEVEAQKEAAAKTRCSCATVCRLIKTKQKSKRGYQFRHS